MNMYTFNFMSYIHIYIYYVHIIMAKYNHNVSPTWISLKQRGNYLFGFGVRSSHVPVPIRVLYNFGYIIYNIYIYIRICLFSSICRYIIFIYIDISIISLYVDIQTTPG